MRGWIVLATLLATTEAWAFHSPDLFAEPATEGGGSGLYFTGAPRWRGWDCSVCHVEADRVLRVELASDPAELFAEGRYQPGETYRIDVVFANERLGGAALANRNTFVLELRDDTGQAWGGYTIDDELVLLDDGHVVAAAGLEGRERWSLSWRAPPAGTGPLTLHLGAVDADGARDALRARTDPLGDDVFVTAVRLCEGQGPCGDVTLPAAPDDRRFGPAACAVAAGNGVPAPWGLVLAALALLARRRLAALALLARRRLAGLALLVAACHDPSLPAECREFVCGDASLGPAIDASAPDDCDEDWVCTSWEAPLGSDQATRTCTDTNQRGTTRCKPTEGPVTLPALDLAYFQCNVEPILDRGCAMMACHGTDTGRTFRVYARGRWRNDETVDVVPTCLASGTTNLQEAASGTIMCEGWLPHTEREWKKNFDSARSFLLGVTSADASDLLAQPVVGGRPHVGVHLFTPDDPDYQTIKAWLEGASLPGCDPRPN